MTKQPYYLDNSISRYKPTKNWNKILFKPDRKLQTTEIEELQDILLHNSSKVYSFLYDFYTVLNGCKILITGITSTGYQCILTEGQVYVELLNNLGFFVDIPSKSFTASRSSITKVGISFDISILKDELIFNNPHTGGAAFGSPGADRLSIKSEIVISTDTNSNFYPLALIKPKTLTFVNTVQDLGDGRPDIFYYKNEELTSINSEASISKYLQNMIDLRLYEMAGDFISKGLYLQFNKEALVLSITPGVAYIKGRRIESTSNYSYKIQVNNSLEADITEGFQYIIYLTKKGTFVLERVSIDNPYVIPAPIDSLPIGYFLIEGYDSIFQLKYKLIQSKVRMPKVKSLITLGQENEKNTKELANLALQIDLLNLSKNNINRNINGIFVDSFVDLDNSDIFNPEFDCSILPSIQAISLPFTSESRNNRLFSIDSSSSNITTQEILNENSESVFYWSTINGNNNKFISFDTTTGSKVLASNTSNTVRKNLNLRVSPSVIYKSDDSTFINYTNPTIKNLTGLNDTVIIDTPINDNVYDRTVNVYASGFKSEQDNIKVEINNILVTSFSMLVGEEGSSTGTVKADVAGNVSFNFAIPPLSKNEEYIISLTSGLNTASAEIKIIDPEVERTSRESNSNFVVSSPPSYSTVHNGLGQVFTVEQPTMLKAVEVVIMDYPIIQKGSLLNVYICRCNSLGLPLNESIGFGTIDVSEASILNSVSPIPTPSRINLDKPINLTRGKYVVVFQTSLSNISLGISNPSNRDLKTGLSYSKVNSLLGPMVESSDIDDTWTVNNTEYLNINLISHVPSSTFSSTVIDLSTTQDTPFDIIDLNICIEDINKNSYLSVFVLDENGNFRVVENGSYFFNRPVTSTKIRIDLKGDSALHPLIRLDNCTFNLLKSKDKATWVSKNQQYETPYNNLNMSVDVYQPDATTIRYYFSSDQGLTWEELNESTSVITTEIVNKQLPVVKHTFVKEELGFINSSLRHDLRYKIEIEQENLDGINPFIKNLVSITNP